jgi:hypothetical protein
MTTRKATSTLTPQGISCLHQFFERDILTKAQQKVKKGIDPAQGEW